MTDPMPKSQPLILMLSYTHVYDDPRVLPMSQSLVKLGYRAQIIGIALRSGLPTHQVVSSVDIWITPLLAKANLPAFLRALWRWLRGNLRESEPNAEARLTNKFAAVLFNLWILRLGLRRKPAAIHCHTHSPPPAAWLLAKPHRAPLVFDSCESVPDHFRQVPNTLANRLTAKSEVLLMPRADAVITVGERLAERLRGRGARQVVVIGNWKRPDEIETTPINRTDLGLSSNQLLVAFFGNLASNTYELESLLQAIQCTPDVALIISGRGDLKESIQHFAATTPNVIWLDWINMTDLPRYTAAADVTYCCLKRTFTQSHYVAPNKLFEAFAAGKPVIALRGVGEMSAILEQTGAGILIDEATPANLQAAFEQLRDPVFRAELQQRSLAARQLYNWNIAEERLKSLYDSLTGRD
jgi:glycosyltransferase involved in cell wall biosynthesis